MWVCRSAGICGAVILLCLAGVARGGGREPGSPIAVNSSRVQLDFDAAVDAGDITEVEVWYTLDSGRTWERAEVESAQVSPVVFHTPHDGLHGVYLIVHNSFGSSSPPPQSDDEPHAWVFVDPAPPIVQIESVSRDAEFAASRKIVVRYNAFDAHLTPRPITIDYAPEGAAEFVSIASDLPPGDRYEWTVPESAKGRIMLRVLACDMGGNVAAAKSEVIDLDSAMPGTRTPRLRSGGATHGLESRATNATADDRSESGAAPDPGSKAHSTDSPGAGGATVSRDDALLRAILGGEKPESPSPASFVAMQDSPEALAHRLETGATASARLGHWHFQRGEWELAETRFREALERDPTRLDLHTRLAAVLHRSRRFEAAEAEYRAVLERSPSDVAALAGLALLRSEQRDYLTARDILRKLALLRPDDAEILMNLGDMQVLSGDIASGRAAWRQARQSAPAELAAGIDRRLLIYSPQSLP